MKSNQIDKVMKKVMKNAAFSVWVSMIQECLVKGNWIFLPASESLERILLLSIERNTYTNEEAKKFQ